MYWGMVLCYYFRNNEHVRKRTKKREDSNMAKIIGSPSRYVQGKGELKNLCTYSSAFAKKLFLLTSASGRGRVEGAIESGKGDVELVYEVFNGECSKNEINRIKDACQAAGCEAIVGIGGGKILDTAKAAAYYLGIPVIIVPTIASTDAPCSALSVTMSADTRGFVVSSLSIVRIAEAEWMNNKIRILKG
jgi:glycerol dehydrogenase-like iron-containing ADH family enzyme